MQDAELTRVGVCACNCHEVELDIERLTMEALTGSFIEPLLPASGILHPQLPLKPLARNAEK
jgi:hypothetical protein